MHVLLIEAGGSDDIEAVLDPARWPANLGSERDWGFQAQPNPHLNDRALSMSMGRVLGGGSSINVMVWARGHRTDWDFFASEAGDPGWSYDNVLDIYRRIENWRGAPDPQYRGSCGPVWIQPASDPSPVAHAMLDAAHELGIPTFDHPNGRMMEGPGGASITDMLVRDGLCRELGNAQAFRPYVKGEVMPGNIKGEALKDYIRNSAVTYWHQTCTAKMGCDSMSVVDASLRVYGVEALRIADGSIMPRVATGNTQAPCAIIGERAAHIIRSAHNL